MEIDAKSSFSNLVRECDRFKVSDRVVVSLTNALLRDADVTLNKEHCAINRTSFRRERSRNRKQLDFHEKNIKAFFFDGKKDQTLVNEGNKIVQHLEEHITLVSKPGSNYCGHVAPKTSTANGITFFDEYNFNCMSTVG